MEYSTTCCISICNVYGEANPTIPEGYKKIDFRLYKKGDTILTLTASAFEIGSNYWSEISYSSYGRPYIILEKLPPKPEVIREKTYTICRDIFDIYNTQSVVLPSRYTYVDFRPPTSGELFLTPDFSIGTGCACDTYPRIILKQKLY